MSNHEALTFWIGILVIMVAMMWATSTHKAEAHPVYTKVHINHHIKQYQQKIRQLRKKVRSSSQQTPTKFTMRSSVASWYGPCCYGNRTADGTRYTQHTWGVAHKTLPFGTMCLIQHGNRQAWVPVNDRGPHVAGREFDLSAAVAGWLRFSGVQKIKVSC